MYRLAFGKIERVIGKGIGGNDHEIFQGRAGKLQNLLAAVAAVVKKNIRYTIVFSRRLIGKPNRLNAHFLAKSVVIARLLESRLLGGKLLDDLIHVGRLL